MNPTGRLIVLLIALTGLGLVGAWVLLKEDDQAAQPAVVENDSARPGEGMDSIPQGSSARPGANDALPTAAQDEQAVPMPETRTSPAQIVGRVLSPGGDPLPEIEVQGFAIVGETAWMRYDKLGEPVLTNDEGRFRLVGVPIDRALAVEVHTTTSAPAVLEPIRVDVGEIFDAGDIRLEKGVRMHGRVMDREGNPIEGAQLAIQDMGRAMVGSDAPEPTLVFEAVTDAEGVYEVPFLGRRQYSIDIGAEGFASLQSVISFMLNNPSGAWEQDFLLERADRGLAGVVLGPEEQPVVGVELNLMRRVPNSNAYYNTFQTTDESGRFRFDAMAEGRYDLHMRSADWYLPADKKLDAGDEDVVLRAQQAITIVGQLVVSGDMPKRFKVSAQPDARTGAALLLGQQRERTFQPEDGSGSFRFGGLRPGTYVLHVEAPGFASTRSQDMVLGRVPLEVPVQIPLRPGGTIVGQLSDGTVGARVELRHGEWDPMMALEFAFPTKPMSGLTVKTGAKGAFRIKNVPAGTYVLTARSPGVPDVHVRDVVVEDEQLVDVGTLARTAGGSLTGTVIGTNGQPLGAANVRLEGENAHMQVAANLDGTFRFEAVPAGRYELVAVPKAFFEAFRFEARLPIDVEGDSEKDYELVLSERVTPNRPR